MVTQTSTITNTVGLTFATVAEVEAAIDALSNTLKAADSPELSATLTYIGDRTSSGDVPIVKTLLAGGVGVKYVTSWDDTAWANYDSFLIGLTELPGVSLALQGWNVVSTDDS